MLHADENDTVERGKLMMQERMGELRSDVLEQERRLVRSKEDACPWVGAVVAGGCALLVTSLFSGKQESGSSVESDDQGKGVKGLSGEKKE